MHSSPQSPSFIPPFSSRRSVYPRCASLLLWRFACRARSASDLWRARSARDAFPPSLARPLFFSAERRLCTRQSRRRLISERLEQVTEIAPPPSVQFCQVFQTSCFWLTHLYTTDRTQRLVQNTVQDQACNSGISSLNKWSTRLT